MVFVKQPGGDYGEFFTAYEIGKVGPNRRSLI